jgi:monoamine oxidase
VAENRTDVVIVGAGLAGLTAAEKLVSDGYRVVVLEARDRVGGRTCSRVVAGHPVDMGAEHVGPHHRRVLALAQRLGVTKEPTRVLGQKARWQMAGADRVSHLPPMSARELAGAAKVLARLARLARHLPVDAPWEVTAAGELDRLSLADWLESTKTRGRARELHELMWQDGFTTGVERISMLHLLWTIRRSGGLIASLRDALGWRLKGGTQTLALELASRLGDRLRLASSVARIEQDPTAVSVVCEGGQELTASRAIIAAPIPSLPRILFSPGLPEEMERAHAELRFGQATTVVVGSTAAEAPRFGHVTGNPSFGSAWRRGPTAKAKVLGLSSGAHDAVAREVAQASQIPSDDFETATLDWPAERFTRGTYINFAPGQLTQLGPHLRRIHGRVHFAAAERSSWSMFMEGAIESGQRAAAEIAVSARPGARGCAAAP